MAEGKIFDFQKGEYPEIEGLGPDAEIGFKGRGRINEQGEMVSMEITEMEFETEGMADREFKQMRGVEEDKRPAPVQGGAF